MEVEGKGERRERPNALHPALPLSAPDFSLRTLEEE
jgi:hypothetical protein